MGLCENATNFTIEGCKDSTIVNIEAANLEGLGRIVQVNVPIKNVCPGKRVAVAIQLTEVDIEGVEHSRGMKTVLIPAIDGLSCRDVELKCIKFVVPEELDVTGDPTSICNARNFKVRVMANYIDTDYVCCK